MSSSVYESLPPDRHTITASPASIMRKSSIALPTSPRRRACRRLKLFEGSRRRSGARVGTRSERFSVTLPGICPSMYRSHAAADSGLPVALRISSGVLTLAASAVHVLAQPVEQAGELAGGDLLVQLGPLGAQALVQLARDHRADRVRREIAERAHGPMHVLQAAFGVVRRAARRGDPAMRVFQASGRSLILSSPFRISVLELVAQHDVHRIRHLVRIDANQAATHADQQPIQILHFPFRAR